MWGRLTCRLIQRLTTKGLSRSGGEAGAGRRRQEQRWNRLAPAVNIQARCTEDTHSSLTKPNASVTNDGSIRVVGFSQEIKLSGRLMFSFRWFSCHTPLVRLASGVVLDAYFPRIWLTTVPWP